MSASIEQQGDSLKVAGTITVHNAVALQQQGSALISAASDTVNIDLSGVSLSGTVGLAVMLSWLRAAQQQNKHLQFSHMPEPLKAVAKVSGLENLLPQAPAA